MNKELEGQGGYGCPLNMGKEGRRARRGAWVGASRHFFFPLQVLPIGKCHAIAAAIN